MNNTNAEKYQYLINSEKKLPSNMAVIPADEGFKFSLTDMKQALEYNKSFELLSFVSVPSSDSDDETIEVSVKFKGETYNLTMYIDPADRINIQEFGLGNQISEDELEKASKQPYMLYTSLYFNDNAQVSFLLQLKILNTIVPNPALVVDFMPLRLLSGDWLKMTASTDTPPSMDYLYTIHAIYEDVEEVEKKGGMFGLGAKTQTVTKRKYWLHTHGLLRCGSVELEMLNIGDGAREMYNILQTAAIKFIEGMPKEHESFEIGYDGMGLNICWVRWEEAFEKHLPKDIQLGGLEERSEEGNVHGDPIGVIFAVQSGQLISPEIYAKTIADNPVFFISDEETDRMSKLAKERFAYFEEAFNKFNGTSDEWGFLVKLGLRTDKGTDATDREHMWFTVYEINNGVLKGELLNQPYWIAGLNKGDVADYNINEVLTDWIIYSPLASRGSFTPDSIYEYYQQVK